MRKMLGLLIVLLVPQLALAQSVSIFGAEKPIPEYSYAELSVKLEKGDAASWIVFPIPVKKTDRGDGMLVFSGPPATTFTVFVTVVNFETKKLMTGQASVVTEGKKPPPIPPDVPPDVPPDDIQAATLTSQLRAVFVAESEEEKPLVADLAAVYLAAEKLASTADTWGNLWKGMVQEAKDKKVNGKLLLIDNIIQKYLKKHLPSGEVGDDPISKGDRAKARSAFKTVATALSKVQ